VGVLETGWGSGDKSEPIGCLHLACNTTQGGREPTTEEKSDAYLPYIPMSPFLVSTLMGLVLRAGVGVRD
jgi:hypothetical protein